MSMEPRNIGEENFGTLQGCLVDGDPEQRAREIRVRRRSLTISILLQAAVLVAVVLIPLFARTERIALANVTPVPPYSRYRDSAAKPANPHDPGRKNTRDIYIFNHIPTSISTRGTTTDDEPTEPNFEGEIPGASDVRGEIPVGDSRPRKPVETVVEATKQRVVHITSIDPAMLKRRVEPVYPPLMIHTRREGKVIIHAFIGADGTMQSLEVVGGDAFFYASALEAVRQWVYKPTILNGQPVQVDTTITVIYSLQH
jgi:periplasmic protein TonB